MTTTSEGSERPFRSAAPFYVQGRLPYARGLADALARALGLDGRGKLLDVGCGPGVVALRLAHLFEEVVGIDIDPDMLAEAARHAKEEGITKARWIRARAEELEAQPIVLLGTRAMEHRVQSRRACSSRRRRSR